VNLPATVEGHEHVRVFVGLPVPASVAQELAAWAAALDAPEARRVRAEDLHLTLAFLGRRPVADLDVVAAVVEELGGFAAPAFGLERYRETRSVGMLVLADEGGRGAAIAEHVHRRLEDAGLYRREGRPWLPHVTVLRFRARAGLRPELPNVRSIAPSDAAAYLSILHPSGATYEIVHRTALGGN
jgi:RNA 2',3'-cyclic 3'-phosphodiesterase